MIEEVETRLYNIRQEDIAEEGQSEGFWSKEDFHYKRSIMIGSLFMIHILVKLKNWNKESMRYEYDERF